MLRSLLLSGGLLVVTFGAARAQSTAPDIHLRLAGGVSSQQLVGPELGLPGLSGVVGLELSGAGPVAARLEYQGFIFAGAGYDLIIRTPPEPRQLNHVHSAVLAAVWRPSGMPRLELAVGPGAYQASSDGPAGTVSSLGFMAGAGFRIVPRLALEAQYHSATLDDARALMPVRLALTF
jgi:hypothetical protein